MPKRITETERAEVLRLLAEGHDRETIAATVGVTPGQVSAVAAHVTMGSYALPDASEARHDGVGQERERTANLLADLRSLGSNRSPKQRLAPILLGPDAETHEEVFWNPDPETGAANPHVLVLGESGFGKTYTISCLLGELAHQNVLFRSLTESTYP